MENQKTAQNDEKSLIKDSNAQAYQNSKKDVPQNMIQSLNQLSDIEERSELKQSHQVSIKEITRDKEKSTLKNQN